MQIADPFRDMAETVCRDEEYIDHSGSAIDPDKPKLISQSDALRNVICKRKSQEENSRNKGKDTPQQFDWKGGDGRWRWWRKEQ